MHTLLAEVQAGEGGVESGLQTLDDQLAEIERTAQHAFDVEAFGDGGQTDEARQEQARREEQDRGGPRVTQIEYEQRQGTYLTGIRLDEVDPR